MPVPSSAGGFELGEIFIIISKSYWESALNNIPQL